MLFRLNNCATLKNLDWHALEFSDNILPVVARVVRRLPSLFGSSPVELFVPVERRDLDVFMLSSPFLYLRSANRRALLAVKSTTGVGGLVTLGDTGRSDDILPVSDTHVQALIRQAEAAFYAPSAGIEVSDFVRILNGALKNFCGTVVSLEKSRADVEVTLLTKTVTISTPLPNLLRLDVPYDRRVFYYLPLVAHLDPELIAPDLELHPAAVEIPPEIVTPPTRIHQPRLGRRTMTSLLRTMLHAGERNWEKLGEACVQGMVAGEITPVASFVAFRTTLQGTILEVLRPEGRGPYQGWFKEHPAFRIRRAALLAIMAPLGLPNTHPGTRPGRKKPSAIGVGNK